MERRRWLCGWSSWWWGRTRRKSVTGDVDNNSVVDVPNQEKPREEPKSNRVWISAAQRGCVTSRAVCRRQTRCDNVCQARACKGATEERFRFASFRFAGSFVPHTSRRDWPFLVGVFSNHTVLRQTDFRRFYCVSGMTYTITQTRRYRHNLLSEIF